MSKLTKAWWSSPGPRTSTEFFSLWIRAFLMGIADLIPGVSGGTIAFITGIYDQVLNAVASLDKEAFKLLLRGRLLDFFGRIHLRFIVTLASGILLAIFTLASLMHWLLLHHPVPTWAAFFGLITASIPVLYRGLPNPKSMGAWAWIAAGTIFGYLVVSLIPVDTPDASWFIYLCGVIGITAMILPGISGSFLLLILGKYEFITGAVKAPFVDGNFSVLLIFAAGTATGLLGFSKILKWCLDHYKNSTMAFLTGILIGTLKKVWPWKETLESVVVRGKVRILREANIIPPSFQTEEILAVALAVIGFALVLILESKSKKQIHD
ncbi:MAG: DUF368 domain-containing protein [bacterium]